MKKICPYCGISVDIHDHPATGTGCTLWRHDDLGGLLNCRNRHNFATLLVCMTTYGAMVIGRALAETVSNRWRYFATYLA
jgi:hypothetical protein